MEPYGDFEKGIMAFGEAPGETEDRLGKPWRGEAGRTLRDGLREFDIDLDRDCISINSVSCRPMKSNGSNRKPTVDERLCCQSRVFKAISEYKPKVILCLGGEPLQTLIDHRWREDFGGIMRWRGWTIPDYEFDTWLCPTLHPSYVMRSEKNGAVKTIWLRDIEKALSRLNDPLPPDTLEKDKRRVVVLNHPDELPPMPDLIAFDYETTGLKPHADGHKIICVSIAVAEDQAYVFMMPETPRERRAFTKILQDKRIRKMAHNVAFEDTWSKVILKTDVAGWGWCSMQAAHILDNRPKVSGLKFQCCVRWGVFDYSSHLKPYMESGSKNANAFNKLADMLYDPIFKSDLLTYCGLDSLFEYRLAMEQQAEMGLI